MKTGRTLTDLAAEIERRANAKRDLLAPVEKLEMVAVPEANELKLAVRNGTVEGFDVQQTAHDQLATYTGIPAPYYRRMLTENSKLLATNVNTWLHEDRKKSDRRLVRTLDGNVRAFLSDRYRTLENEDLAEAVLPILLEKDYKILSCEVTDRRLYIKAVDSSIEKDIPTGAKLGDGHTIFDTVSPAVILSNSEVGLGSLSVDAGVWTRMCTNLASFGASMRKYHSGARMDVSEEVYALLQDSTKKLTDAAVWAQVKDIVAGALDVAKFEATLMRLGKAAEVKLPAESVVEVVEKVGRRYAFNEGERKGILAKLIEGGNLTQYGLHAAVTRYSADVVEYDRATELERIGGQIVELSPSEFHVEAA